MQPVEEITDIMIGEGIIKSRQHCFYKKWPKRRRILRSSFAVRCYFLFCFDV